MIRHLLLLLALSLTPAVALADLDDEDEEGCALGNAAGARAQVAAVGALIGAALLERRRRG